MHSEINLCIETGNFSTIRIRDNRPIKINWFPVGLREITEIELLNSDCNELVIHKIDHCLVLSSDNFFGPRCDFSVFNVNKSRLYLFNLKMNSASISPATIQKGIEEAAEQIWNSFQNLDFLNSHGGEIYIAICFPKNLLQIIADTMAIISPKRGRTAQKLNPIGRTAGIFWGPEIAI